MGDIYKTVDSFPYTLTFKFYNAMANIKQELERAEHGILVCNSTKRGSHRLRLYMDKVEFFVEPHLVC